MRHASLAFGLVAALCLVGCGQDAAGAAAAGRYSVDRAHLKRHLLKTLQAEMGTHVVSGTLMADVDALVQATAVGFEVKADGTWNAQGVSSRGPIDDSGTWTLQGTEFIARTLKQNGKEVDGTSTGTYVDGTLLIKLAADDPFALRFIRE